MQNQEQLSQYPRLPFEAAAAVSCFRKFDYTPRLCCPELHRGQYAFPVVQTEFALSLLSAAKEEGISTAVETSGAVPPQQFERVIGKCDLFLFDIKAPGSRYQELTGADFELVYRNLRSLSAAGNRVILRVPMVRGKNADEEFLALLKELSGR